MTPVTWTVTVVVDRQDFSAIQAAITRRQLLGRYPGCTGTTLPDGDSDLAGAIIAEICRGWMEMLDLHASGGTEGGAE